uniref:hypothetical protein n=1 Tax=Aquitalea sp. ASV15 TaxID=2795104 RepID=UPI0018ED9569
NDGAGSDHVYNKTESGAVVVSGSTTGVEAGQTVTVTFTDSQGPVSYTHLTLPTNEQQCRSRWSPDH